LEGSERHKDKYDKTTEEKSTLKEESASPFQSHNHHINVDMALKPLQTGKPKKRKGWHQYFDDFMMTGNRAIQNISADNLNYGKKHQ
jgi:hypothetical protein